MLEELEKIKTEYKKAKGRKLHAKATPLREGVIVISEDTTIDQIKYFASKCRDIWGLEPLQIYMHKDEGHWETENNERMWKPNLHAHIVWRWCDDIGVTCKLDKDDMSKMQTILSECLNMSRGVSSEKKHLQAIQYKAKAEEERLQTITEEKKEAIEALKEKREELQKIEMGITYQKDEEAQIRQNIASLKQAAEVVREQTNKTKENAMTELENIKKQYQEEKRRHDSKREEIEDGKRIIARVAEIQAKDKEIEDLKFKLRTLEMLIVLHIGEAFSKFCQDCKKWFQGFSNITIQALLVWDGEIQDNGKTGAEREVYDVDYEEGNLLVNGYTIDRMEQKRQEEKEKESVRDQIQSRGRGMRR